MEHFLDVSETIPDGYGFSHFDSEHLIWLVICAAVIAVGCFIYLRLDAAGRKKFRTVMAVLLVAVELFKQIPLQIGGNFRWVYLPFHLCSVNIFIVLIHVWKPSKTLDNFLYCICLPAALAALVFPGWDDLPVMNFMYLHSWLLHILLVLYPLALTLGGDIKPQIRHLPKALLLLIVMAAFFYWFNYFMYDLGIKVNFFYLRTVAKNNPLYIFKTLFGNHLYGMPIVVAAVILVMYGPLELYRKLQKKTA